MVDVVLDLHHPINVTQVAADFKLKCIGAEVQEEHCGRWVGKHDRLSLCDLLQDAFDALGVGAIGHTHRHDEAAYGIATRVVGDRAAD